MNHIEEIKALYNNFQKEYTNFEKIDTAYLFTNENIKDYIQDLSSKRVLSIASSGDHYITCLLNGATDVDLFDINYLSKLIIVLKKTAIEYLDYEEFLRFLGITDKEQIFSYDIFKKFYKYLDEESYSYWKKIYEIANNNGHQIYDSNLIVRHNINLSTDTIPYLNEKSYLKLKNILSKTPNTNFICIDINNLEKNLNNKYDVIFLSNINMYQKNTNYIKTVKHLANCLNQNGQIYFAYIYNYGNSNYSLFYDNLLKSQKYESKILISGERKAKDKVYILNKK